MYTSQYVRMRTAVRYLLKHVKKKTGEHRGHTHMCEGISPLGYWQKVNQSPTQTKPYNTYPPLGLLYEYQKEKKKRGYNEKSLEGEDCCCGCCCCCCCCCINSLHIKPFFPPNDVSSTPSVRPDSSPYVKSQFFVEPIFCGHRPVIYIRTLDVPGIEINQNSREVIKVGNQMYRVS